MEFRIITDLAPIKALTIQTNAAALEKEITEKVAVYKTMVVTPETRAAARQDLANLRKAVTAIDKTYTAVRAELLRPADELKAQRERLKEILDEAIKNLDAQVKGFDEQEEREKLDELHAFFDSKLTDETREIADWDKIRNPRWKNKTFPVVEAHNAIIMALGGIERDMKALRNYPEPYKSVMIEKYGKEYRLSDAISWYTETKAREAERKRREEEAARRAAEEAAREEEAARAARTAQEHTNSLAAQFPVQTAETPTQPPVVAEKPKGKVYPRRVEFWAVIETKEQGKALAAFLKDNGIEYGAINREG